MYFLEINIGGINIDPTALLVNPAVAIAVSAATKDPSPTPPIAASGRQTNRDRERSTI
jgi:hypothetical protein